MNEKRSRKRLRRTIVGFRSFSKQYMNYNRAQADGERVACRYKEGKETFAAYSPFCGRFTTQYRGGNKSRLNPPCFIIRFMLGFSSRARSEGFRIETLLEGIKGSLQTVCGGTGADGF